MTQRKYILNLAIAAMAVIHSTNATAASLLDAIFFGQAQQQTTNGEIVSCGVIISAVETLSSKPVGRSLIFNGSLMVYGPKGGLVKGRVSDIDSKSIASGKLDLGLLKPLPSERFWMKAPNVAATEPNAGTEITLSEDPGYKLYSSSFDSTWGVIRAILDKTPVQIGFKVKGRNVEQVMFGEVQMTDGQRSQLEQCLGEWSAMVAKKYSLDSAKESAP